MTLPAPKPLGLPAAFALLGCTTAVILGKPVPQEPPPAPPEPKVTDGTLVKPDPLPRTHGDDSAEKLDRAHVETFYLSGYVQVQQAESLEKAGDFKQAAAKLQQALEVFRRVRREQPNFQANMVAYRISICEKKLVELIARPSAVPFALPPGIIIKADSVRTDSVDGKERITWTGHVRVRKGDVSIAAEAIELAGNGLVATQGMLYCKGDGKQGDEIVAKFSKLEVDSALRRGNATGGAELLRGPLHLKADTMAYASDGTFRYDRGVTALLHPDEAKRRRAEMLKAFPPPSEFEANPVGPSPK